MTIRCVIFDIDGTMADTLDLCVQAFQHALLETTGTAYRPEEITRFFNFNEVGILAHIVRPEELPATLEAYYQRLDYLHNQDEHVLPGIRPLLAEIHKRGIPMGVVTGKGERAARATLESMDLLGYFRAMACGSDENPDKRRGLVRVLEALGQSAADSVYIGDLESDMRSAESLGMWAAGAAWASTATLQPDGWQGRSRVFATPAELGEWLLPALETE